MKNISNEIMQGRIKWNDIVRYWMPSNNRIILYAARFGEL